jgi:subtilisin family serine protease
MGPSRDGRQKPEIAAPGQFVSAALASGSRLAGLTQRADTANRVLTIEGTSMSAPVMTGVVALMLQKKPTLTLADLRTILQNTSRRDAAIGAPVWDPNFGFGKIDVAAAIDAIGMAAAVGGPTS